MKRWIAAGLVAGAAATTTADEGMWRPGQLGRLTAALDELGLEIETARLGDLTGHPMNAVISLGGCTASFVSPQGLVVTNHHCAYSAIQYNSSEERNLLETGFLAADRGAELPAGPGSRIWVTVAVDDVTERVLAGVEPGMEGGERYAAIEAAEKEIVAECEEDEGHRCTVRAYHGGLEYERIKQLEILDVRLVYAPVESIGKYGGDVDNWMWPRHTGDFSFYRAYVGPDGKPAEHAEENVPFSPPHYLEVSGEGVGPGDLVLVAGYPGSTGRYRLAAEAEQTFGWSYPTRIELFQEWLDLIEAKTAERPDAALKYASLIAGVNNAAKNYRGMLDSFAKGDLLERKQNLEAELESWMSERREGTASVLDELRQLIAEDDATRERDLYYGFLAGRSVPLQTARTLYRLAREGEKPDPEREPGYQDRDRDRIEARLRRLDRTYDPQVDRASWERFLLHYADLPEDQRVAAFDRWLGLGASADREALAAKLDAMYSATELGDLERRLAWMEATPSDFHASDDPFIEMAVALFDSDLELEVAEKDLRGRLDEVRPRYMAALIDFLESEGRPVYPDANGTLRVTYGTVTGYSPRDGVSYQPFTTLRGILQKNTGESPFDAPQRELAAIHAERYGAYGVEVLDSVPVNFLSTVDTTGGNSGSATLNGRGELVGLLFDGNWESIIADWDFNPEITRSIHVDMRYVLWVMDEIDGAGHLLRELGVEPRSSVSDAASSR